ncbi:MAG TPA: hypothetical protein VF718_15455 [Allosphingosinicella sp.]|jgi:hypothetical protein
MRLINVLTAAAAISLAGTAAAKEQPNPPKEKKICQVVESANGRIPERRICKTKAEWDAAAQAQRGGRPGRTD